jgi:hypothetical protein
MHVTEAQINQAVVVVQCAAGAVIVFRSGLLDRDDLRTLNRLLRHTDLAPDTATPGTGG